MTVWRVHLLGHFQLWRDDLSLTHLFETDSARALFAWLCLNPGRPARRDVLAALLWPDKAQAAALSALRTTLTRIRRALTSEGSTDPLPLRADAQTVALDLTAEWSVDALRFEQAYAGSQSHLHRRLVGCVECLRNLRQVVAAYQGELLAGLSIDSDLFTDWLTQQREHFHHAALDMMRVLAERAILEADWPAARSLAEQQLRLEPWGEEAHRQMMMALANVGQRTAALAQFQVCQRVLQKEFGAQPDPATRHLAEAIREGNYPPPAPPPTLAQSRMASLDRLPLVGRQSELESLVALLNQPTTQLISLVGEGGIGKTRLSIRAAQQVRFAFDHGARFIFLHPEDQPERADHRADHRPDSQRRLSLALQIAHACDISLSESSAPETQVINALKSREYLLVLDSFEHALESAGFVSRLLEAAPRCAVLITSRQRLHLRQEQVVRLSGLSVEQTDGVGSASAQLFLTLTRRMGAPMPAPGAQDTVERICAALRGLPLGIELAAACLTRMSLVELQATVQNNLSVLTDAMTDAAPRHHSLQAVFDSAWRALSDAGRSGLVMLSGLRAPCPASAARALTGSPQTLAELLEHSLVHQLNDGSLWMHEHIRQCADAKLMAASDGPALAHQMRRQHAKWFLGWLAQSDASLRGTDSRAVRERLTASFDDLRAAWQWALEHGEWEWASAAVRPFEWLYRLNGWLNDGVEQFSRALRQTQTPANRFAQQLRARLLISAAALRLLTTDQTSGVALLREAVALAERSEDALLNALAMSRLGSFLYGRAESNDEARALFEKALAATQSDQTQSAGDDYERLLIAAETWRHFNALEFRLGHMPQAEMCAQQALDMAAQCDDQILIARCLESLAIVQMSQHKLNESERLLTRALDISRRLGMIYQQVNTLDLLAQVADACGDYALAQRYYHESLALAQQSGNRDAELVAHINLGISCDQMGDYAQALSHTQVALALLEQIGASPGHRATTLSNLSLHAHHNGQHELALRYAREATALAQQADLPELEGYAWDFQGHALLELWQVEGAGQAYRRALAIREKLSQHVLALETRAGLARVALRQGSVAEAGTWVEPIAAHLLNGGNLHGAEETLRVYWTTYQALFHNDDPRAEAILQLAVALLQERASRLSDESKRAAYLNVAAHRHILEAGLAVQPA